MFFFCVFGHLHVCATWFHCVCAFAVTMLAKGTCILHIAHISHQPTIWTGGMASSEWISFVTFIVSLQMNFEMFKTQKTICLAGNSNSSFARIVIALLQLNWNYSLNWNNDNVGQMDSHSQSTITAPTAPTSMA